MPMKSADTEVAVSGGRSCGKVEMEAVSRGGKVWRMRKFYFILTTSTIYPTLVLIVKLTRLVYTKYSNWTSK
jgi:hypothetical protein